MSEKFDDDFYLALERWDQFRDEPVAFGNTAQGAAVKMVIEDIHYTSPPNTIEVEGSQSKLSNRIRNDARRRGVSFVKS